MELIRLSVAQVAAFVAAFSVNNVSEFCGVAAGRFQVRIIAEESG
jgi:hypothetical protein